MIFVDRKLRSQTPRKEPSAPLYYARVSAEVALGPRTGIKTGGTSRFLLKLSKAGCFEKKPFRIGVDFVPRSQVCRFWFPSVSFQVRSPQPQPQPPVAPPQPKAGVSAPAVERPRPTCLGGEEVVVISLCMFGIYCWYLFKYNNVGRYIVGIQMSSNCWFMIGSFAACAFLKEGTCQALRVCALLQRQNEEQWLAASAR